MVGVLNIDKPNYKDIIGDPLKRFEECYREKGDGFRSYYHGWIEGRVSLYAKLGVWDDVKHNSKKEVQG
jgi:hypothetical protein